VKKPKTYAARVSCPMCDFSLKLRWELADAQAQSSPYAGGWLILDNDEYDFAEARSKKAVRKPSPSTKRSTKPSPKRKRAP